MIIFIKKCFAVLLVCSFFVAFCGAATLEKRSQLLSKANRKTKWEVSPSLKYDTLCFLNILTGDPFYVRFYKEEYAKFEPQITPSARQALANLKRKIKDEKKGIVSANLSLYFSATRDETIDDMLKTLRNTEKMRTEFKKSTFYSEEGWQTFESVKEDLRIIFLFLKDIQFEKYWKQNILPEIRRKIAEIKPNLPKYNIINEVEKFTGYSFSSNKITAYVLRFPDPHGIRVTGLRFIMSDDIPFKRTVFIAIHELIHEPVRRLISQPDDLKIDAELQKVFEPLRNDEFLMDKVKNHNPSLGYNTLEGLLNEDTTQALDQIIGEKLGVEREQAHKRWKEFDEGIHVFAVALYSLMKEENFPQNGETLRNFLLRMFKENKLGAGKIKPIYDKFYKNYEKG